MANEWQTAIESNGALGLVLLMSEDPDIRTYAQQRMEKNSARVDILQDKFNRELTSEQGIKLLKTIGEKRQVYADTLVKALQISEQGDRGALNNFIRSQQLPIINDYIASLQALVEYEKTSIDKAGEVIDDHGTAAILTLIITGCMALLLGGVLALEPNKERIKGKFIKKVLLKALPAGLTDVFVVGALVICGDVFSLPSADIATAATLLLAVVGFMILIKISEPFNKMKYAILFGNIAGLLFCGIMLNHLFAMSQLSAICMLLLIVFGFAAESLFRYLTLLVEKADEWVEKKSRTRP